MGCFLHCLPSRVAKSAAVRSQSAVSKPPNKEPDDAVPFMMSLSSDTGGVGLFRKNHFRRRLFVRCYTTLPIPHLNTLKMVFADFTTSEPCDPNSAYEHFENGFCGIHHQPLRQKPFKNCSNHVSNVYGYGCKVASRNFHLANCYSSILSKFKVGFIG